MADSHKNRATSPADTFMTQGWDSDPLPAEAPHPGVASFAARRDALSARFPAETLVVATGTLKTRANDDDFRFRPSSDFYYLTGSMEPDGVLVMQPDGKGGHTSVLYVMPRSDQTTPAYFRDPHYGEMWIGPRRGLSETQEFLGVPTADLSQLSHDLRALDPLTTLSIRGVDQRVDRILRSRHDTTLATSLSEARLVKDPFEISLLERAVGATARGFDEVVGGLPGAIAEGERFVEGTFNRRARIDGNDVGYGTIAAAGVHATTLHWTRNDGPVQPGNLLLLDAGVEDADLYTADVTRTVPVSGTYSKEQAEIYSLVLAAQKAGIEAAVPGAEFLAPHKAAVAVLAKGLKELGIPAGNAGAGLSDAAIVRRYMPHGTSHMLGLDVHDCAQARDTAYRGDLHPGYVLTVEPGLYFKPNDSTVPPKYRGIGIRIEDDILITETGNRNLSAAIPKEIAAVERWVKMEGVRKALRRASPSATPPTRTTHRVSDHGRVRRSVPNPGAGQSL